MNKKTLFYFFILSIIFLFIVVAVTGFNFFSDLKKFKNNDLGYNYVTPIEYADVINRFFTETSARKKSFYDKNRNPIVLFKNADSQIVYVHKLSVSNRFSFDSVILENKFKDVVSDDIYNFLLDGSTFPLQVRLNSKIDVKANKIILNFDGQLLSKIEKTDSMLKLKILFNTLSIRYQEINIPDIYMQIDNGNSTKKFVPQTFEFNVVNSIHGFFLILINTTPNSG